MRPIHGQALGLRLCQVFNIDPSTVQQIALICNVHGMATLEVTHLAWSEELHEMTEIFQEYELTKIDRNDQ